MPAAPYLICKKRESENCYFLNFGSTISLTFYTFDAKLHGLTNLVSSLLPPKLNVAR